MAESTKRTGRAAVVFACSVPLGYCDGKHSDIGEPHKVHGSQAACRSCERRYLSKIKGYEPVGTRAYDTGGGILILPRRHPRAKPGKGSIYEARPWKMIESCAT